ncbi:MAG: DNA gyrase inhibitor YacG [Deltaproteobacteria bacterium]|nr:DNA gyrase inhibitor YacG [Deltaproteobacteria bacterium]
MAKMSCPQCRQEFVREESRYFPFCSKRCQMVDFGTWMSGGFRVPGGPVLDDEEEGLAGEGDGGDGTDGSPTVH